MRLKSDEDLAVAQEWIDRGGDYRRAIEILETQLQADPGYARLEQALARAREMRYVTPERFARVEPGMTALDVRAALGPVNLREVRRRPPSGSRPGTTRSRGEARRRSTSVTTSSGIATSSTRPSSLPAARGRHPSAVVG